MFNFRNESGWFQVLQHQTQHGPPSPSTPGNFANNKFGADLPLLQVAHPATASTQTHPQLKRAKNCCGRCVPSRGTSSSCAPGPWLCPQLHGAPGTSRDGDRDLQTLGSHHIQIIGSCGTSTSRERGLIVMSYISVWHPRPLNTCICLGTVIPFVCFLLTQTVICLVYTLLN